jgi:hypothetical protein
VGGSGDNNGVGAAWVFTSSSGVWTEQTKLVGAGAVGNTIFQGVSVALSGDGDTALVGGSGDYQICNSGQCYGVGATWVFTQSGGSWTQLGSKLVGSGYSGPPEQGTSVALSADGVTAVVGGPLDDGGPFNPVGAAWVFAPTLTLTSTASGTTQVGQAYSQTNLASGGSTPYTYTLSAGTLPAGTTLDPSGGTVSGTPTTAGAFSYAITATTSGFPPQTATQTVSGTIAPATLTLASTASTTTQVGQAYSQTNVASGGTTPYTYIVSAGSLPAGATLNAANGTVFGTPTTAGAFGYTIEATDSGSPAQTATQTVSGTIAPATLTLVASASSTMQLGQFYRQSNVAGGGTAPYTYTLSAGTLPAGTTLSASNGTVFGTLSAAGAFSYTIEATDSGSPAQTATQVVSGTIAVAAPSVAAVSPNGGPPAGGTSVTITGTNFTGASAVSFGGAAASRFAVNSATSIAAIAPAGSAGTVDVTVTTGNGTSAKSAADHFTYASPRMTQQGPKLVGGGATGKAEQGTSVALSADGNTAILGGPEDNSGAGAAWIGYRRSPSPLPGAAGSGSAPASSVAPSVWIQAGSKLVGSGASGPAQQGYAVALSADGTTAIVGGYNDNAGIGAVWVFTRRGEILPLAAAANPGSGPVLPVNPGPWSQQGAKLIAGNETGAGMFGVSVALSSDGNTAIVGGSTDSSGTGAAWIFIRSNGVWSEEAKLIGAGAVGNAFQGISVALSSDGNTALIGGYGDNAANGAAWVFVRSGATWTQQGSKLLGSGNVGAAAQGYAVALSSDGNTALVGGFADNTDIGAGWIFSRSGGVWTQVGSKLVGTGAIGTARQGFSVALSGDASTAAIAGYEDNAFNGAVWVFTQSAGAWTQFGSKLFGSGAVGPAEQGSALALSANGTTLIEGGASDNSGAGAAWVFVADGAGAFTATPSAGQGPLGVTFSASGLTPPMTYTVSFGDGTTGALSQGGCIATPAADGEDSTQCSAFASHSYTNAGTDTATLLNASGIPLGSATITVNASTPSVSK